MLSTNMDRNTDYETRKEKAPNIYERKILSRKPTGSDEAT